MRIDIVENTGQRLRLALRTSVPLYAMFGLMFIGLGLVCIRLLAMQAHIVVEQQHFAYSNTCLWVIDCGELQAAAQDVRGVTMVGHEIQVELPDGPHRLTLPASDGDEKAAIARDIQAALSQPGSSFQLDEGQTAAALLLGLVCLGVGLVILSAIQWVSLVADRTAGTLELGRRLLFQTRGHRLVFNLADVEAVLATPHTLRTGRHIVTSYAVRLQLRGQGREAAVGITFLPMFTEAAATDLARIIRGWLALYSSQANS